MNDAAHPAWSDLAERTEALAMQRMMTDQPAEVVERLGVSAPGLADGVHTVVVRDPMWGYWNKALGFCETVTDATVAEAVDRASNPRRRRLRPAGAAPRGSRRLGGDHAAVRPRPRAPGS